MRIKQFLMGLFGVAMLSACSNDTLITEPEAPIESDVNSRFMTVRIRNVDSSSTRAGGDQMNGYEEGLDYENHVSSVRFYFFDENGAPYKVSYTGLSYVDCKEVAVATDPETDENGETKFDNDGNIIYKPVINMPNEEKQLEAMIVLTSTDPEEDFSGIKAMVAIANNHLVEGDLGTDNLTLEQLKGKTGNYSVPNVNPESSEGQFVMTSSSFGASNEGGKKLDYGCEVEVEAEKHIKPTRDAAEASPVDLYIERLVAKVRVTANWNEDMTKKIVIYGGKEYVAVQLLNKKADGTKGPITAMVQENDEEVEKNVYLLFNGWDLSGVVEESYLFKKVNNDWSLGWSWNDADHHRSYWAVNTDNCTHSNPTAFKIFKHEDALKNKVGTKLYDAGNNTHVTYDGTALYCFENAAEGDDGKKPIYDPDITTRNRTVAYISGKLVTLDNEDSAKPVAKDLEYAEWGGDKYTESGLISAMFKPSENIVYVRDKEPYKIIYQKDEDGNNVKDGEGNDIIIEEKYHYYPITVDNVELVNAETVGKADNETENSKRYLSYIILKQNIEVENAVLADRSGDIIFYKSTGENEYTEMTRDDVNDLLTSIPGAKVWRNGDVYYYVDLMHIPTLSEESKDKGAYGVVRNHIYEVEINSLFGLGTPVLDPRPGDGGTQFPIDPQKPSKDAFYLGARINILSWRVVNNTVDIDW